MSKKKLRRSGAKIMASLILLLGSLAYIMILAVINGSIGFICAMGVTVFGAVGVAKALGETIAMSYGLIIGLAVGCGVLRGILRYFEQYSNHFIAFKLLAVLRDKIFGALRTLCPAKLESKQKGSIIAMIFRGYKNDWACVFAGTLYMPLTLPLLYMYYNVFYTVSGEEKAAVSMFIGGGNVGLTVGISFAVVAVCFVGSVIGMVIARELKKAGKLK